MVGVEIKFCFESLIDRLLFFPPAFGGLGDMLMPAMAPQPAAGAPMAASPVKPVGGDLDSTMANLAGSEFQYSTPQALLLKLNVSTKETNDQAGVPVLQKKL